MKWSSGAEDGLQVELVKGVPAAFTAATDRGRALEAPFTAGTVGTGSLFGIVRAAIAFPLGIRWGLYVNLSHGL